MSTDDDRPESVTESSETEAGAEISAPAKPRKPSREYEVEAPSDRTLSLSRKVCAFEQGSYVVVRHPFLGDRDLSSDEKVLLIALDPFVRERPDGWCFPGDETLARCVGWFLPSGAANLRKVQRVLDKLELRKTWLRRAGGGKYGKRSGFYMIGTRTSAQPAAMSQVTSDEAEATSEVTENPEDGSKATSEVTQGNVNNDIAAMSDSTERHVKNAERHVESDGQGMSKVPDVLTPILPEAPTTPTVPALTPPPSDDHRGSNSRERDREAARSGEGVGDGRFKPLFHSDVQRAKAGADVFAIREAYRESGLQIDRSSEMQITAFVKWLSPLYEAAYGSKDTAPMLARTMRAAWRNEAPASDGAIALTLSRLQAAGLEMSPADPRLGKNSTAPVRGLSSWELDEFAKLADKAWQIKTAAARKACAAFLCGKIPGVTVNRVDQVLWLAWQYGNPRDARRTGDTVTRLLQAGVELKQVEGYKGNRF